MSVDVWSLAWQGAVPVEQLRAGGYETSVLSQVAWTRTVRLLDDLAGPPSPGRPNGS